MSEFTEHVIAVGKSIVDGWYWIAGVATALWYATIRLKHAVFKDYVTNTQMSACKNEIIVQIEIMRKENNTGILENAQQHQDILKTVVDAISDLRRNP